MIQQELLMPFGKYKGIPVDEVPANYLLWLYQGEIHHKELLAWVETNFNHLRDLRDTGLGEQ
jgi:uncharacterized protein (DUF3820 family)